MPVGLSTALGCGPSTSVRGAAVVVVGGSVVVVGASGVVMMTYSRPSGVKPPLPLNATTDGIGTRWDLNAYPGLEARHPTLIAAVLYRDFARARDDASVLVIRQRVGLE